MLRPLISSVQKAGSLLPSLASLPTKAVPAFLPKAAPAPLPPANLMSSFSRFPATGIPNSFSQSSSLFQRPSPFPIQQTRGASFTPSGSAGEQSQALTSANPTGDVLPANKAPHAATLGLANSGKAGSLGGYVHFYASPEGTVTVSPSYDEAEKVEQSKTPSAAAAGFQGQGNYPGVDSWKDITLPKGFSVGRGYPGTGAFATTASFISQTGFDATKINKGLQIAPRNGKYRSHVEFSVLKNDTRVGFGKALNNTQHGGGGAHQFYIPSHADDLKPDIPLPLNNADATPSQIVPYKKSEIAPFINPNGGGAGK